MLVISVLMTPMHLLGIACVRAFDVCQTFIVFFKVAPYSFISASAA